MDEQLKHEIRSMLKEKNDREKKIKYDLQQISCIKGDTYSKIYEVVDNIETVEEMVALIEEFGLHTFSESRLKAALENTNSHSPDTEKTMWHDVCSCVTNDILAEFEKDVK
jgi:hypothetical protein